MEPQLEKIRETQKESWNKSSQGWKKWDDITMRFLKPLGDEMITMLQLKTNDHVLDVATGTGEPGLTMASLVKDGRVTATDLAAEMLAIAKDNAYQRGNKNFETVCCDVSEMPFEDNTFDAISCRLGFMFFPDMQLALREMIRILKPGGRICTAVWSIPEKNPWISISMNTMISKLQLTPPPPGAPGLFRCANPGFMENLFREEGLKGIMEKEVQGNLVCDSLETYWSFITEVACPMAFKQADDATKHLIKDELLGKIQQVNPGRGIQLGSSAIVISGEK